jgi:hypothetical protein
MRASDPELRVWSLRLILAASLLPVASMAAGIEAPGSGSPPASATPAAGLYVEVRLSKPIKGSALKAGDILDGTLARDVYAGERDLFPAGSTIHLVVSSLEKRKREHNDHWPGVIGLFSPRHVTYPVFRSATVVTPGGETPLDVSLISVTHPVEVRVAKPKRSGAAQPSSLSEPEASSNAPAGSEPPAEAKLPQGGKQRAGQTLILEATGPEPLLNPQSSGASTTSFESSPVTLNTGTQAQIVLLAPLSASKSRPGDSFHARLIAPVLSGSRVVLPAGSLFDGKVVRSKPPRWLSRPGSLYLTFTELTLPGGNRVPVAAQITGAEADRRSHLRIDSEGGLSGGHPGKAWMLINLGVTAGISKEADDTFQVIVEALVSTATDASTAGSARIVAACASSIYMVTRHGRDVVLPRFTKLDVTFNRPLALAHDSPGAGPESGDGEALLLSLHH